MGHCQEDMGESAQLQANAADVPRAEQEDAQRVVRKDSSETRTRDQ
jgi:hypothetical protein